MPDKTNSADGYVWELSDFEETTVKNAELPQGWEFHREVASGFLMFVNRGREEQGWQEAGIGPTDEGKIRTYVSTEQEDGTYETNERFEGEFHDALEKLMEWLREY